MPKRRVLIVAYKCSPYRGSEWAVGWGRVVQTALRYETWVITGELSRPELNRYFSEHGQPAGMHFHFLGTDRVQRFLESLPRLGAYNYPAYRHWLRRAYRLARELHQLISFHVVHHVNISTFREPGYLWNLDVPFIWGPVGGTQLYPWRFLLSAGLTTCFLEGVRNLITLCQLATSRSIKRAVQRAAVVLAATSKAARDISHYYGAVPVLLPETGLHRLTPRPPGTGPPGTLRILWCGELAPHKALHLLLRALGGIAPDVSYEVRVVGQGPDLKAMQQLAAANGVAHRCKWTGWIPHQDALLQYLWADVFVFTSLRDTSGNVLYEALSCGVPILCLDHQGAADIVGPECGIKIPVSRPRQVIHDLRIAIETLARNPGMLTSLSRNCYSRAERFLWARNGERMATVYERVWANRDWHDTSPLNADRAPRA